MPDIDNMDDMMAKKCYRGDGLHVEKPQPGLPVQQVFSLFDKAVQELYSA